MAARPKSTSRKTTPSKKKAATKRKTGAAAKAKASAKAKGAARSKAEPKAKSKPKTKAKAKSKAKSAKSAPKKASVNQKSAPSKPAKKAATKTKKAAKKSTVENAPEVSITRGKVKILPREFLLELATSIKESVQPVIATGRGKEVVGSATSGDVTFLIDKVAEKALLSFLRNARMPVAYYSEDAGYTTFTSAQPEHLLVVDPIDGTRAAKSGFESCVVSLVSTRVIERPTVADVDNACVMEILGPRAFYAQRGKGARIYIDGQSKKPKLSNNKDLETVVWSMTVPARPAELIFPTAAKLIDLTSLKGGFFACNSTAWSLTRLLTGQLDATVDFANRYLRDIYDAVEDHFINAGRGSVIGVAPYDLAAPLVIAEEAGCTVTDAYGRKFQDFLLLDSSVANHQSVIAASSGQLHKKLLGFFDTRIRQYERLLQRRADLLGD